jgi:hypothetical protein
MRNTLAAIVAGLLLFSGPAARAGGPDNPVTITQAMATRLATASGGNVSQINQAGNNNYAETDQFGSNNYAGIGQFGDDNYAKVVQNAIGAVAVYNQYGNGNQVTITQTGVNPQPVVVTQRR